MCSSMVLCPICFNIVLLTLTCNSPRVKILTLHAYRSLARSAPSLIQDASVLETLKKRLMDAELAVVRAALRLGENIAKVNDHRNAGSSLILEPRRVALIKRN